MKLKIIIGALLVLLVSTSITTEANAAPWRYYRHRYWRPYPVVRVVPPVPRVYVPAIPAPVVVGGYYRPYHCRPHYYRRGYCHPHYRYW